MTEKERLIKNIKEIGKRMKKCRQFLDLTQQEMGDNAGVQWSSIGSFETGRQNPGALMLYDLAKKYDISPDWLFFNTGNMFRKDNSLLPVLDYDLLDTLRHLVTMSEKDKVYILKQMTDAMNYINER